MSERTEMQRAERMKRSSARDLRWASAVLAVAVLMAMGCQKPAKETPAGPRSFATPEEAGGAVYTAAKSGDAKAVQAIFGPNLKEILLTGDAAEDKRALEEFAGDYEKMHRWSKMDDGGLVLSVGLENYPFPFPLEKNSEGKWSFNNEKARNEIAARLVGKNELTVISVVNEMADAQREYFSATHDGSKVKQYAQKWVSSEGKHDGLYWKSAEGEPESPLGPLAARASAEGYTPGTKESPEPFHGYFYRILKQQGAHAQGGAKSYLSGATMTRGFAILAYPAEYRKTGVMTFMVDQNGVIFQKDLGEGTVSQAKAIDSFDPDDSWTAVE